MGTLRVNECRGKKIRIYTSSGQDTINLVGNVSPPNPLPRRGSTKGRDSTPPLPPRVKGWRRLIDISDSVRAGIERFLEY